MATSSHTHQAFSYPEIYLAIDNCFASKRFTEPADWMKVIRDLGIFHIEASADTECDPLYHGRDYLAGWVEKVKRASSKTGVSVCNLYSGHGTYATLGLSHTDSLIRNRILDDWLKPMIQTAAQLGAGLGFYCHAFDNIVLQKPALYQNYKIDLISKLAEIARFSDQEGCKTVGIEQMYSPHQIPWTIKGAKELLNQVAGKSQKPFYITIDTGHQSGQSNFLKPTPEMILHAMEQYRYDLQIGNLWLGPDSSYELFEKCDKMDQNHLSKLVDTILEDSSEYPYLFAEVSDCSTYLWLEELACYSPIIHLQQTDGKSSLHLPFTQTYNQTGRIEGTKIIEAISKSYENPSTLNLPKVDCIYLTIEVFASTASINYLTLKDLRETVRYWRQFVPKDGMKLNELIKLSNAESIR